MPELNKVAAVLMESIWRGALSAAGLSRMHDDQGISYSNGALTVSFEQLDDEKVVMVPKFNPGYGAILTPVHAAYAIYSLLQFKKHAKRNWLDFQEVMSKADEEIQNIYNEVGEKFIYAKYIVIPDDSGSGSKRGKIYTLVVYDSENISRRELELTLANDYGPVLYVGLRLSGRIRLVDVRNPRIKPDESGSIRVPAVVLRDYVIKGDSHA